MQDHRPKNYLLRTMADADFAGIAPALVLVDHLRFDDMALPEAAVRHVWFPLSGIVSVVATIASGTQAEVAIVGREGVLPFAPLFGVEREAMHVFTQISGQALRLPAAALRTALAASPGLQVQLLAYAHSMMVVVANSALAYATQTIEARLARWLMMCLDRLDGSEVNMTHETFAMMLGVRRAGITVALQTLEGRGAIACRRGTVRVTDRTVLAHAAGSSYGATERETGARLASA